MVDLKNQYLKIDIEINQVIKEILESSSFINGPQVDLFIRNLSKYLDDINVIPCANGTDALQVAMMALDLNPGDEVIIPSFTYAATAEVIGLLKLTPIMVDVDPNTFMITIDKIKDALTDKTKAIVPVHLFGQCVDMEPILEFAKDNCIYVIEDNAQALGAHYIFKDGTKKKAGTMGDIGCTSFFPTKNLGCYGDGGAIFTKNSDLANKIRMICNHGQIEKYSHKYIGVNSRLDSIQAAILNIKLKYIDEYIFARQSTAKKYDKYLSELSDIKLPSRSVNSSHVFHQYTIKVINNKRDELKNFLKENGIPSMIYYPIPLNKQDAYKNIGRMRGNLNNTDILCNSVLSLPMHTEQTEEQIIYITDKIKLFFNKYI